MDPIGAVRDRAADGDANAQYELGERFRLGRGVPLNPVEAGEWYCKAARKGHARALDGLRLLADNRFPEAQTYLGSMCLEGEGVPVNGDEAVDWFRKAATQGYAEARRRLVLIARGGNSGALLKLGELYDRGLGVKSDAAAASKWYYRAARRGCAEALSRLSRIAGDDVSEAQCRIGVMHLNGQCVRLDHAAAVRWLARAAENFCPVANRILVGIAARDEIGDPDAQYALGRLNLTGRCIPRDTVRAARWLRRAAERGHTQSLKLLRHNAKNGDLDAKRELDEIQHGLLGLLLE